MAVPVLVRDALARYRARLERALPGRVHRVALFGSYARGEATEDSDVDVLIVLDDGGDAARARAIDEGAAVGIELLLPIAPLVLTQAEWDDLVARERLLAAEIMRDGIAA
jgi:predicted nucleotidyltransferase